MSNPQQLVQKHWSYWNVLPDDGLSYGDYIEQLTFLLFLKMSDEGTKARYNHSPAIPEEFDWLSLLNLSGDAFEALNPHTVPGSANLPSPVIIAADILVILEAAPAQYALIAGDLGEGAR